MPRTVEDQIVVKRLDGKQDDLTEVFNLRARFHQEQSSPFNQLLEKYDKYSLHFLAFKNTKPIGVITLVMRRPLPLEEFFNINRICGNTLNICEAKKFIVLSEDKEEARDISLRLILEMCKYLVSQNCLKMFITVSKSKEKNVDMYKDLGFKEFGRFIDPEHKQITALYLDIDNLTNLRRLGIENLQIQAIEGIKDTGFTRDIMSKIFLEYLTSGNGNGHGKSKEHFSSAGGKKSRAHAAVREDQLSVEIADAGSASAHLEVMWKLYQDSFGKLKECAQLQMCYSKAQLKEALADEQVTKFILFKERSEVVGFSLITNNLELATVAYMNPSFYEDRYPNFALKHRLYYVTTICIAPELSSSIMPIKVLLKRMIEYVTKRKAMVAFDVSENKNILLPLVIKKVGQEMGKPITHQECDSQVYWECHDIRHE
ncbi:MAG: hypothetical protein WC838_06880 [Candidatus Margulisiibacteriota bacterium]|jgi:hypothetical protein